MATYLFSENRELKNIQDGDVVVWDICTHRDFVYNMIYASAISGLLVSFNEERTKENGEVFTAHFTAHFTRTQTEPQTAPDIPVPCGNN